MSSRLVHPVLRDGRDELARLTRDAAGDNASRLLELLNGLCSGGGDVCGSRRGRRRGKSAGAGVGGGQRESGVVS